MQISTRVRVLSLLTLAAIVFTAPNESNAQNGAVHGISLSGQAQGGCQNLTGFSPPRYPGLPGRIPCEELFSGTISTQGQRTGSLNAPGELLQTGATTSTTDVFGNSFEQESLTYRVRYGLGNDNYSEFAGDNASRTRDYSFSAPSLVNALNVNPALKNAVATQRVVDGSALGFEIEGGKLYIEVPKNSTQSIEIFPVDPDGNVSLTNPSLNPYSIGWVAPNNLWTPHSSIPEGISFSSSFDQTLQRWRYFLTVTAAAMESIGKYVVFFELRENQPKLVQYFSQVEGLITWNSPWITSRILRATLTIGYGTEQCVAESNISIPSMEPLLGVYETSIKKAEEGIKRAKKLIRGAPKRSKPYQLLTRQLRRIARAKTRLAAARAHDLETQSVGFLSLDQGQQVTRIASLTTTARGVISPGRTGSAESVRRLHKGMQLLLRQKPLASMNANERKELRRSTKTFKGLIKAGDKAYGLFHNALLTLEQELAAIRADSAQCGALGI